MKIGNISLFAVTNDIFKKENKHYITIWMKSDWLAGEPTITEPERCTGQQWADFQSLPEPLFEPCWQNLRTVKSELFG